LSGRIVAEILDHAPPDLTALQRLVLVALGEAAPERDRIARYDCSAADLARRTGATAGGIRNATAELTRRGLVRPLLTRAEIMRGKHQEYEIARLGPAHRLATFRPDLEPAPNGARHLAAVDKLS